MAPVNTNSGARQVWVRGIVWHPTKISLRLSVTVLVDTGAGGGNYASQKFIHAVESSFHQEGTIISAAGKGVLSAANPADSNVPPMNILGSVDLPVVFPPDDHVHIISVRVVDRLPYGLIVGAAFMRKNGSVISFLDDDGFKPSPGSPWVPFLSHGRTPSLSGKKVKGWRAFSPNKRAIYPQTLEDHTAGMTDDTYDRREQFGAVKPPTAETEPTDIVPPDVLPSVPMAAWEDDCTLQWVLYNGKQVQVDGYVSLEVDAYVRGPQPQDRQLVMITPLPSFDLELAVELGVARGVQWWFPHTPFRCKLVNVSKTSATVQRGMAVANVYALNASDVERMKLLTEPSARSPAAHVFIDDMNVDITPTPIDPLTQVDLSEANIGQLSSRVKDELMSLLRTYRDKGLFALDPKKVDACKGPPMELPLMDEQCVPFADKQRRWSPQETKMIQTEVEKNVAAGVIRRSTSPWAAGIVLVRKKDGTLRMCQDFRVLNERLVSNSGGLGDITTIHSSMGQVGCSTSIDLASGFNQIPIAEKDKFKTAFRDANGELWELNRCGFGLKTLPAAFAARVGAALGPLKGRGVNNWLDDIIIHTKTIGEHLSLLERVLDALSTAGLSLNLAKCKWCFAQQEFLGLVVDRLGLRPAPSKIEAIKDLKPASNVEELRAIIGMSGFLRRFVPHFSSIVAPLTDILRSDPRFASKRSRKMKIPWGVAQDEALSQVIHCLTSPPILALPDWFERFILHTDASETGGGAALTQIQKNIERAIAFASHRWSRTDERRSPTEREAAAVLWAVEHFRHYLWGRKFTLVTDCSALTWLFKSRNLSPKLHRWALRLMEFDMCLEWKEGRSHHLPDALSRLPRFDMPGEDIDTSFPGDSSTKLSFRGPKGPVLDGVLLSDLGVKDVDYQDGSAGDTSRINNVVLAALAETPMFDEEVRMEPVSSLLTLEPLPVTVVLFCGGGGNVRAAEGILDVQIAIEADWRALECARVNEGEASVRLMRTKPGEAECDNLIRKVGPQVIICNIAKGADNECIRQTLLVLMASKAKVLVLECSNQFLTSELWKGEFLPVLVRSYCFEVVELQALQLGVPSKRRRTFVAMVARKDFPDASRKLLSWKAFVQKTRVFDAALGNFLDGRGTYYLDRKVGERCIFSFEDPVLAISRAHIMGIKPLAGGYQRHKADAGDLEQAGELSLRDFKKIQTEDEDYLIPPTVSRGAAADILSVFSLPSMMREVLIGLKMQGFLEVRVDLVDQVVEGLAALEVTPAVTRGAARRSRNLSVSNSMEVETNSEPMLVSAPEGMGLEADPASLTSPVVSPSSLPSDNLRDPTPEPPVITTDFTPYPSLLPAPGELSSNVLLESSAPSTDVPSISAGEPKLDTVLSSGTKRVSDAGSQSKSPLVRETIRLLRDPKFLVERQNRDPFLKPISGIRNHERGFHY